jgi:Zn-dependent protease
MALAGPAANFALAAMGAISVHAGLWAGVFHTPATVSFTRMVEASTPGLAEGVAQFLSLLFSLNMLLGVFNLLPIPPLNGFSAVALFMSEERAKRFEESARSMRNFSYVGLFIGWHIFNNVYGPLMSVCLKVLYPWTRHMN